MSESLATELNSQRNYLLMLEELSSLTSTLKSLGPRISQTRDRALNLTALQRQSITGAWRDTVAGFAQLESEARSLGEALTSALSTTQSKDEKKPTAS